MRTKFSPSCQPGTSWRSPETPVGRVTQRENYPGPVGSRREPGGEGSWSFLSYSEGCVSTPLLQLSSSHSVPGSVGTHQELRLFRVIKATGHFKTSCTGSWTTLGSLGSKHVSQGGRSRNKTLAGSVWLSWLAPHGPWAHTCVGQPACFPSVAAQHVSMLQRTPFISASA